MNDSLIASGKNPSFRLTSIAAALAFVCLPTSGFAWEFGPMQVKSERNAPFRAEVKLLNSSPSDGVIFVQRVNTRSMTGPQAGNKPWDKLQLKVSQGAEPLVLLSMDHPPATTDLDIVLEGVSGNSRVLQNYPLTPASFVSASSNAVSPVAQLASLDSAAAFQAVSEQGVRPSTVGRLNASGQEESAAKAFSKIVPKGWRGYAKGVNWQSVDPVTWSAKDEVWLAVLDRVLVDHSMQAVVDWKKKEVTFKSESDQISSKVPTLPDLKMGSSSSATVTLSNKVLSLEQLEQSHARIAALQAKLDRQLAKRAEKSAMGFTSPSVAKQQVSLKRAVPEGWSVLTNDHDKMVKLSSTKLNVSNGWQAGLNSVVEAAGGSVIYDLEKKRILVSLA